MKTAIKYLTLYGLVILSIVAAILLAIKNVDFNHDATFYLIDFAVCAISFFLIKFLHSLIHELGHLFMGLSNGFAVYRFKIGFFELRRVGKKFKIITNYSRYAGMLMMYSKSSKDIYKRFLRLASGGIIGSVITTIVFMLLLVFCQNVNDFSYIALCLAFPTNCYILLLNAISFSNNGVSTDGAVISGILKSRPETLLAINLLDIQAQLFSGKTPREIEDFYYYDVPVVADNDINAIQLQSYLFAKYLDERNEEKIKSTACKLETLTEYLPSIYESGVLSDVFYYYAIYEKDYLKAEFLYSKIERFLKLEINICNLRIRTAYELFILNKPKLALATAKTALAIKDDFFISGIAKMEESIILELVDVAKDLISKQDTLIFEDTLTEYKGNE